MADIQQQLGAKLSAAFTSFRAFPTRAQAIIVGLVVVGILFIGGRLEKFFNEAKPAPAAPAPVASTAHATPATAATTASAASVTAASPGTASAPSTTAAASTPVSASAALVAASAPVPASGASPASSGAASSLVNVLLPGQPEPAGLKPRTMQFVMEAQNQEQWSPVGSFAQPAGIASFTSKAPEVLAPTAPTDGIVRNTYTFWTHVDHDAQTTFALHMTGDAPTSMTVSIDDSQTPLISAKNDIIILGQQGAPVTADAGLGLGAGWHKLTVAMSHQVARNFHGVTTATLYMRGAKDGVPVAVVPSAAPVSAGQ